MGKRKFLSFVILIMAVVAFSWGVDLAHAGPGFVPGVGRTYYANTRPAHEVRRPPAASGVCVPEQVSVSVSLWAFRTLPIRYSVPTRFRGPTTMKSPSSSIRRRCIASCPRPPDCVVMCSYRRRHSAASLPSPILIGTANLVNGSPSLWLRRSPTISAPRSWPARTSRCASSSQPAPPGCCGQPLHPRGHDLHGGRDRSPRGY